MEAPISTDSTPPPSADEGASNEIQALRAEHLRVISLRLQGKRWSEIAHELGVTPWTVWHWRQEFPEIDQLIAQESQDYFDATRIGMASLLPLTVTALREVLAEAEPRDRIAAAKVVLEAYKRSGDASSAASARMKELAALDDGDLDAELSALLASTSGAKPRVPEG